MQGRAPRSLRQELLDVYARQGWPWEEVGDPPVVISERAGSWPTYVHVDDSFLVFYTNLPTVVPPDRREAAAEFITRANYGLSLGNLEMDFEDGEVRAKVVLVAGDEPLGDALVDRLLTVGDLLAELFVGGIDAVVAGAEPGVALGAVTGSSAGPR